MTELSDAPITIFTVDSDAGFNLGMALATAQVATPGIYIAMNGTVFRADQARKDRIKREFVREPGVWRR